MQGRGDEARRAISASGLLSLIAVSAVVAIVSFPLLRRVGMAENGADALRTLELLGSRLETVRAAGAAPVVLGDLAEVGPGSRRLERELSDGEWLEGGRLFRRHGYDFELDRDSAGTAAIRAQPWAAGETGERAYAYLAGQGTFEADLRASDAPRGAASGAVPGAAPGAWTRVD